MFNSKLKDKIEYLERKIDYIERAVSIAGWEDEHEYGSPPIDVDFSKDKLTPVYNLAPVNKVVAILLDYLGIYVKKEGREVKLIKKNK